MKKLITALLLVSIIFTFITGGFSVTAQSTPDITIKVNGKTVVFKDVKPFMSNGLKAPISELAQAMGAKVAYNSTTNEVEVTRGTVKMAFKVNKRTVMINGKAHLLLESVSLKSKKTVVPVRFLVENLGGKLDWNAKTNTASVTIKDLPKTTETSIIPKAKTEFKPYVPELTAIDSNTLSVLKKYKEYEDDKPDDIYVNNERLTEKFGYKKVEEIAKLAKGYAETQFNIDYRTIDENYLKQMKYFYMPGSWDGKITKFVEEYAKEIIKYKVIAKCEFVTDTSLVYLYTYGDYRVKGRQKVMFYSAAPEFFIKNQMPILKLNTWYQIDREIGFGINFGQEIENWEHSYYTLSSFNELSSYIELK